MSKYYPKMLLSILLLAALITGCSSSTDSVETTKNKSINFEEVESSDLYAENTELSEFSSYKTEESGWSNNNTEYYEFVCTPPVSEGIVKFDIDVSDSYSLYLVGGGDEVEFYLLYGGEIRVREVVYRHGSKVRDHNVYMTYESMTHALKITNGMGRNDTGVYYEASWRYPHGQWSEIGYINCSLSFGV